MNPSPIFTIGHSTHTRGAFDALLAKHGINVLVDVRSAPYSRFVADFNKPALEQGLRLAGVKYLFLGRELGARPADATLYRNGQVQFDLLAATPLFQRGIERVLTGSRQYRIALMCAERDPLQCHRTLLVARTLVTRGATVEHILFTGQLESHAAAMERLLGLVGLPSQDMFRSWDELVAAAVEQQAARIAYVAEAGRQRAASGA